MKINPYLNFQGRTEEAFTFYKDAFGVEFSGLQRFKDVPGMDAHGLSESEMNQIMHVAIEIGETTLMGTDALESMGHKVTMGNHVYLSIHPDSKEEADRIFAALSEGGKVEQAMQDMFWGDYWGSLTDKFGVQWMLNYSKKAQ